MLNRPPPMRARGFHQQCIHAQRSGGENVVAAAGKAAETAHDRRPGGAVLFFLNDRAHLGPCGLDGLVWLVSSTLEGA